MGTEVFDRRHLPVGAFEKDHFFVANGAPQGLAAQGFEFGLGAGHIPGVLDEHVLTSMAYELDV
jgi:hypothetical protein